MWESALFLALAGAAALVWQQALRIRELALDQGEQACRRHNLQFLDQSVHCISMRPARNAAGRLVLRRIYRFEFSDDGLNRRSGHIVMLGDEQESLFMEPYLVR